MEIDRHEEIPRCERDRDDTMKGTREEVAMP